ncbi:TPA: hypothetical protein ACGF3Q_001510 [Vibrio cholerae]
MDNEQIIAELRLKLEKAEAEKQAAIEFHLNAFANQIFDQMLKHYKTHKFGPLTMAKDYILNAMAFSVGDVVAPIKPDYQLASGCGRYESAVVVSVEPFVLVSHAADMRWQSTVKREQFKIIGKVKGDDLSHCLARLEK